MWKRNGFVVQRFFSRTQLLQVRVHASAGAALARGSQCSAVQRPKKQVTRCAVSHAPAKDVTVRVTTGLYGVPSVVGEADDEASGEPLSSRVDFNRVRKLLGPHERTWA